MSEFCKHNVHESQYCGACRSDMVERYKAEIEELKEDVKGRIELIGLNSRYTTSVEFKNKALRELVKEAIVDMTAYSMEYYDCKEEWLKRAKEVVGE